MKPEVQKGQVKRLKRREDPSQNDVNEVNHAGSVLDRVEEELAEDGITMFDNGNVDNDYLQLPPHLDTEESYELGRYLHTFTQQKIWARTLIARVGALLREKEEQLEPHKERVFSAQDKKLSITEKELKLSVDELAKPIIAELKYIQEKYNMLSTYIANLEDGIFDLSREVSRRGGDFKDQNRVENVQNKRK
jgi:hypothetical protein